MCWTFESYCSQAQTLPEVSRCFVGDFRPWKHLPNPINFHKLIGTYSLQIKKKSRKSQQIPREASLMLSWAKWHNFFVSQLSPLGGGGAAGSRSICRKALFASLNIGIFTALLLLLPSKDRFSGLCLVLPILPVLWCIDSMDFILSFQNATFFGCLDSPPWLWAATWDSCPHRCEININQLRLGLFQVRIWHDGYGLGWLILKTPHLGAQGRDAATQSLQSSKRHRTPNCFTTSLCNESSSQNDWTIGIVQICKHLAGHPHVWNGLLWFPPLLALLFGPLRPLRQSLRPIPNICGGEPVLGPVQVLVAQIPMDLMHLSWSFYVDKWNKWDPEIFWVEVLRWCKWDSDDSDTDDTFKKDSALFAYRQYLTMA